MSINIQHNVQKTNQFGGLNFLYPEMVKSGVLEIIDSELGQRVKQAKYSHSQIVISHILSIFAGAKRLDHANNFKRELDNISGVLIPSPDTTSRVFRLFAVDNIEIENTRNNNYHKINYNQRMNNVLVKTAMHLNLINKDGDNVLDYDNTILQNRKFDSTRTYKHSTKDAIYGYQPALASINGIPFFIEGRSGHTTASSFMFESFERCINQAKNNGIRISKFRADSASYNKKLMELCEEEGIEFFISQRISKDILERANWEITDWSDSNWKGVACSFGSMENTMIGSAKSYRIVCKRIYNKNRVANYAFLVTNNRTMTNEEVFNFYAMRGAEEKRFAELKNEFNFKRCPFSLLEENTVFMIVCCISYNIYKFLLRKVAKNDSRLHENNWLRVFRKLIISVTIIIFSNGDYQFCNASEETLKIFRKLWEDF